MDHTDFDFIGNLTNSTFSVFDANKVIRDNNLNATSLKYYFIKAFHDHLYDNHVKKKIPFFTKKSFALAQIQSVVLLDTIGNLKYLML